MNPRPLYGVVYGHGRMGKLHVSKLAQRSDISLAIVDEAQGLKAQEHRQADFAIIATPTHSHKSIALPLLAQGVPCLVEKPLANTLEHAQILAQYEHLSVGHIERFNPVFSALDHQTLTFVDIQRLAPMSKRSQDIDVIGDLMIHDLDLLLKRMPGTVSDVRAKGVGIGGDRPDMVAARIEIQLENGETGVANLRASRMSPSTVRTWRVFAPGQYWSLDLHNHTVTTRRWSDGNPGATETVVIPKTDPLSAQHTAFFGAIRGEQPYTCSGSEALAALVLADCIRKSLC